MQQDFLLVKINYKLRMKNYELGWNRLRMAGS